MSSLRALVHVVRRSIARLPQRSVRFAVVGSSSFVLDIGLLYLIHGVIGFTLAPATTLAFFGTLTFNFVGQGRWVFGTFDRPHVRLLRYLVMVAVNAGVTLAIVVGLTSAGLFYLVSKVVAAAVVAGMNYVAYRFWVFGATPRATSSPAERDSSPEPHGYGAATSRPRRVRPRQGH